MMNREERRAYLRRNRRLQPGTLTPVADDWAGSCPACGRATVALAGGLIGCGCGWSGALVAVPA